MNNTDSDNTRHECGLSTQAVQKQPWEMTRRSYIDSLIAAGEMFGVSNGLPTKLVKTTPKGVRTENGRFVPYDKLSHVYEHRCRVEEAIRKGKPVPAEVLDDYPDLQARLAGDEQS